MAGIVYALSNPAMPKYIKIGKTNRNDPMVRMDELYTTGVPVPFECIIAVTVEDETAIENALQIAFRPYRLNPKREFFEIEPEQVIALLHQLGNEDVTPRVNAEAEMIDQQSRDAGHKLKSKRPMQNFHEMGIPDGAILTFQETGEVVTVVGQRKVEFRGDITSLTAVTRELKQLEYNIQPGPHWFYNGRSVSDIYNETYSFD